MNSVIRQKGLLLTAAIAAACCVFFFAYEYAHRYGLEVSVDLSSSTTSTSQLFFDTGRNFNEQDSRNARVVGVNGWQHLSFKLPTGRIKQLRFDPATTPGSFVLRRVAITHSDGSEILIFGPQDLVALSQISSRIETSEGVLFVTQATSNDSSILFRLAEPLGLRAGIPVSLVRVVAIECLLTCLLAWLALLNLIRIERLFRELHSRFTAIGKAVSVPVLLDFDGLAMWFIFGCGLLFVIASLADLNGSSIAAYQTIYSDAKVSEVAGEPRGIRSDEWAFHTPAILNQIFRKDPLAVEHSSVGGHSVALISNLPVRHFSTIFRPQFWSFFVLPPRNAFAVYWQFKGLILLVGVFCFLLLLSQSSFWAMTGSIWYYLSPHIQWTYSSPNLLPEMVGALCFAVVFFCLLTAADKYWQVVAGAVGLSVSALDFALCVYVPNLVPLAWVGVFAATGCLYQNRAKIHTQSFVAPRLIALVAAVLVIGVVLLNVLHDAHAAIAAISDTVHPGKRVFSGGYYPVQYLFSDFFAFSEGQDHVPPALLNICEASGFFWLAPAVLFSLHRGRSKRATLVALFCAFFFLLSWCVFPIATYVGKWFALDRTWTSRCLPALGLANVAIVIVFLGSCSVALRSAASGWRSWKSLGTFLGVFFVALSFLLLTNQLYGSYFSLAEAFLAAAFLSVLISLLKYGPGFAFATLLIAPHALVWGLVNPVEQGIGPITSSSLFRFVHGHRELLSGKWAVFSPSFAASGFIKAMGCDVYNGEQYQPDLDHFRLFASNGLDIATLNRLGYLLMEPLPNGSKSSVQLEPNVVLIEWKISPFDPMIRQLGIKYLAFDEKPSDEVSSRLVALSTAPISGFWLYVLR